MTNRITPPTSRTGRAANELSLEMPGGSKGIATVGETGGTIAEVNEAGRTVSVAVLAH